MLFITTSYMNYTEIIHETETDRVKVKATIIVADWTMQGHNGRVTRILDFRTRFLFLFIYFFDHNNSYSQRVYLDQEHYPQ